MVGAMPASSPARRWIFFGLAGLCLLMHSIDMTIVSVALRTIVEDFDTSLSLAAWTIIEEGGVDWPNSTIRRLIESGAEETGAWRGEVVTATSTDVEGARASASRAESAARTPFDPAVFALFRWLSARRGRRIFHPRAAAYAAHFTATPSGMDALIFADGFEHEALVRLSRGLGVRPPLPDVFGLAVRLPDAYGAGRHQDFLLASSGDGAIGRRLLRWTRGARTGTYSSLLPYEVGTARLLVGARPAAGSTSAFDLLVAQPTGGWRVAARLTLERQLDQSVARALRFDPWNSGGGLVPAGFANRLRGAAYRGSQCGSVA